MLDINGATQVNRKIFGLDLADPGFMVKHGIEQSRKIIYLNYGVGNAGLLLEREPKTEDEIRKLVYDDAYWQREDVKEDFYRYYWFFPDISDVPAEKAPRGYVLCFRWVPEWMEKDPFDRKAFFDFFEKEHPEILKKHPRLERGLHNYLGPTADPETPKDRSYGACWWRVIPSCCGNGFRRRRRYA